MPSTEVKLTSSYLLNLLLQIVHAPLLCLSLHHQQGHHSELRSRELPVRGCLHPSDIWSIVKLVDLEQLSVWLYRFILSVYLFVYEVCILS